MQVLSGTQPQRTRTASVAQLFGYPFRIFFLSLTVLSLVLVPLWVLQVTGTIQLPLAMPGLFWHQHEMLFGFLSAAVAGFLLTAVCVWTGTERTHGARLFLLFRQEPCLYGSGAIEHLAANLNKCRAGALGAFATNCADGNATLGRVVSFRNKVIDIHFVPHVGWRCI